MTRTKFEKSSMHGIATGEDIVKIFVNHFVERGIVIRKIFSETTDCPFYGRKTEGMCKDH